MANLSLIGQGAFLLSTSWVTITDRQVHSIVQELLLKCNTGTTRYIESVADRRAGAPASEADQPNSVETDNEALEKIMGIVSSHAQALPPPPEAVTQADDFLAKLAESEKKDSRSRDVRRGRRSSRYSCLLTSIC